MFAQDEVIRIVSTLIRNGTLPNMSFHKDSILYGIIDSIPSVRDASTNDVEAATRWITDLYAKESPILEVELERLAEALVKGLKDAIVQMKNINTIVSDMAAKVDARINQGIALNPKLAGLITSKMVDPEYSTLDLNVLDILGRSLALTMEDEFNFPTGADAVTKYERIMDTYVSANLPTMGDVSVEYDKASVVQLINDQSTEYSVDDVKTTLDILRSGNRINGLISNFNRTLANGITIKTFTDAIECLRTYGKILDRIYAELLNRGYEDETLKNNYRGFVLFLERCHYFVDYHIKYTYATTVLLPNGMLNPLMELEFKASGISVLELARHVRFKYNDVPLPRRGITLEALQTERDRITALYQQQEVVDDTYRVRELSRLKRRAIIDVTSENFATLLKPSDRTFIEAKADAVLREDTAVEDILFRIVMVIQFNDQPTMKLLYDTVGKALNVAIRENPDASDAVINKAMLDTYMEVATNVIGKVLCISLKK